MALVSVMVSAPVVLTSALMTLILMPEPEDEELLFPGPGGTSPDKTVLLQRYKDSPEFESPVSKFPIPLPLFQENI